MCTCTKVCSTHTCTVYFSAVLLDARVFLFFFRLLVATLIERYEGRKVVILPRRNLMVHIRDKCFLFFTRRYLSSSFLLFFVLYEGSALHTVCIFFYVPHVSGTVHHYERSTRPPMFDQWLHYIVATYRRYITAVLLLEKPSLDLHFSINGGYWRSITF